MNNNSKEVIKEECKRSLPKMKKRKKTNRMLEQTVEILERREIKPTKIKFSGV